MKQPIENAVQQYLAAWNTKDPSEVKAGFEKCLSANCTYTDKNTPAISGIKGFTDFVAASHKATPGRLFSLRSEPEYFSNKGRYFWSVSFPDKPTRDCMDFFEFDNDNFITAIVGFV